MSRGICWEVGPQHPDVSQRIRSKSGINSGQGLNVLDWVAELLQGPANFPDVTLVVDPEKALETTVRDAPPLYFPFCLSLRREKVSV